MTCSLIYINLFFSSLFDFGKYLELVFYTNEMNQICRPFCAHTSGSISLSDSIGVLGPRFCLLRHFSYQHFTVSFRLEPVNDIYHAQIPRTQVTKSMMEVSRKDAESSSTADWLQLERDKLRLDMTFCWKSLKDHLHWLVSRGFNRAAV